MSISSVTNDLTTRVSVINALKPLPPTISGYSVAGKDDLALDPAGGQTVQINGTGFLVGATITFDGSAVAIVTFVNANQLTFTSPAKSAGTYTIYVVNPDGGTAIYVPGIVYSLLPTWSTSAGSLGSYYETTSISNTVVATGDAPITYSLFSGSLPTGATLSSGGVISGTAPVDSGSTTYSFTIQASDAQLQDSTRSFSLTINTDVVTWVSPANNTTYSSAANAAIANVTLSATDAAGYSVSYSANALPTGLSLSGANISGTPTVVADSSTLLTATAATTNRTSTRTINWSITVANDTYWKYNTLLIPGASTTFVDDASTNNFGLTINGDTRPYNFNPYTPGYYSNYFNGSSAISIPTTQITTGSFTTECWFYRTTDPANYNIIFGGENVGAGGTINTQLYVKPTGAVGFVINAANATSESSAGVVPTGQWSHVVWVRSGTTCAIFVNGTRVTAGTSSGTLNIKMIGAGGDGAGGAFGAGYNSIGYISNARITTTAVYDPTLTTLAVPTAPLTAITGTTILTCQSNRFVDNSTNAYALTIIGSPQVQSFQPFTPNNSYSTYGSGYFDGSGDSLSLSQQTALSFGTGDFTVESWVYPTANPVSYWSIIDARGSATAVPWAAGLRLISSNLKLEFYNGTQIQGSITVPLNTWTHIAYTRSGTTFKGFVNGVVDINTTMSTNLNIAAGTQYIGAIVDPTYNTGYISDVRIVKGTAVYTSAFTPPTAPLTAITNTQLLTLQNNQSVNNNIFLDNSSNNFLVTRYGNTTQGTFSPYGGNWSNYFNGSSYLSAGTTASNFLCTGSATGITATFEAWVYPTAYSTGASAWMFSPIHAKGATYFNFGVRNGAVRFYWYDGTYKNVDSTSTSDVPLNTWTHIALTISASTIKIYVNGVLNVTSATYTGVAAAGANQTEQIGFEGNQPTYFSGYISNYRLNSTVVYSAAFTPSTTPLTAISGTSLLTCQSNSFIYNNTIPLTVTGTPTVQRFSPFHPSSVTSTSYSGYFDGSGDYLTLPDNTALEPSSSNLTWEMWINTINSTQYATLYSRTPAAFATGMWSFMMNWSSSTAGDVAVYFADYSLSSPLVTTTGVSIRDGAWHHIALVRNGSAWTIYIDGTSRGTGTWAGTIADIAYGPYIGADQNYGRAYLGYISNLRIVKGTAVYTSNFTPSTTPLTAIANTSLLTLQSTTFIDNSTNNFTITAVGDSKPSIQNPFGYTSALTTGYSTSTIGGSGYFDGSGDYLTVPSSSIFQITGNVTIEAYVYATAINTYQNILSQYLNSTNAFACGYNSASGWYFNYRNNAAEVTNYRAGTSPLNAWTHVAFVKSSTTMTVYINGTALASTITVPDLPQFAASLYVGLWAGASDSPWVGYISDLRMIKGAVYTSNFVPPSAPLTAIQNSSLLLNMVGAGVYDAAMMNNMETVGDAKLSTAVSKFGGSSMAFDGTGDWLLLPASTTLALGSGDFTVEMWMYPNLTYGSTYAGLLDSRTSGDGAGLVYFGYTGTANQIGWKDNTTNVVTGTVTQSTWNHVAVVRSSGTMKLYINGTSVSTGSNSTNYTVSFKYIATSFDPFSFNGYIDDLRITKGYARYTANFTPPTSAFLIY